MATRSARGKGVERNELVATLVERYAGVKSPDDVSASRLKGWGHWAARATRLTKKLCSGDEVSPEARNGRAVAAARVAAARATVRFETRPGEQLQIDFGERRVEIGGFSVKVFFFVAGLASAACPSLAGRQVGPRPGRRRRSMMMPPG